MSSDDELYTKDGNDGQLYDQPLTAHYPGLVERLPFRDITTLGDLPRRDLSAIQRICDHDANFTEVISVVIVSDPCADPSDQQCALTLRSVLGQCYRTIELILPEQFAYLASRDRVPNGIELTSYPMDPNSASKSFQTASSLAKAELIVPLRLGDRLAVDALYRLKAAEIADQLAPFFYSDIVSEDENHRLHSPLWHSNWDWILMAQTDATKGMLGLRRRALSAIRSQEWLFEFDSTEKVVTYRDLCWSLALKLSTDYSYSEPCHIAHLSYIETTDGISTRTDTLRPRRMLDHTEKKASEQGPMHEIIRQYISSLGLDLSIEKHPDGQRYTLISSSEFNPRISIVIPNRDGPGLLANALDSILNTNYRNLQIIIVDDASVDSETYKLYDLLLSKRSQVKVEVIETKEPTFNYSRLINLGRKRVDGEYMVTMNNDVELISRDTLDLITGLASLPKTGVVGTRLLYEDLTIQHVGVALGINRFAGHYMNGIHMDKRASDDIARNVHRASATTGALQLFRTDVFDAVGGYDEEQFPVAFNDVDFCLRVGELGLEVLIDTRPIVFHYEGKTRGNEHGNHYRFNSWVREEAAFAQRWGGKLISDPFYPRIRETLLSWQSNQQS